MPVRSSSASGSISARGASISGWAVEERDEHRPRALLHARAHGLHLGVAAAVAEDHLPRVRARLDVGEPGLEDRAQARVERLVLAAGDEATELGSVLLEQREIQRLLGREVAIEHRLGDMGGGRDVVEPRARVAALGEEAGGLLEEDRPPCGSGETPSDDHSYRRVTYCATVPA